MYRRVYAQERREREEQERYERLERESKERAERLERDAQEREQRTQAVVQAMEQRITDYFHRWFEKFEKDHERAEERQQATEARLIEERKEAQQTLRSNRFWLVTTFLTVLVGAASIVTAILVING